MNAAPTTPALANDAKRGSHWQQRMVGHPSNVLNLYAGVGGNRKLWQDVNVTAVENEPKIAAVYQRLHPTDTVIIGDAHAYLLENYNRFDFIWTSPPCQTHSKMAKATRHKLKRYPDMSLYQQIIFLRTYAKCPWVVENVVPYYAPLIPPTKQIGRHLFWANFDFEAAEVPQPANFINRCNVAGKLAMQDWLGIHYPENIYYGSNHCPAQILRNCVHPLLGAQIWAAAPKRCAECGGSGTTHQNNSWISGGGKDVPCTRCYGKGWMPNAGTERRAESPFAPVTGSSIRPTTTENKSE